MAAGRGSAGTAALFAAGLLAGIAGATPAEAASRFCRDLEARLAEPAGSAQFRKYQRAADEQYEELIQAERQAERRGCFDGYYDSADPLCPGLLGTIERMDRNLLILERRIEQLADRHDAGRERARIMAALEANRCFEEEQQQEIRILPPPIDYDSEAAGIGGGNIISGPFYGGATYRTLCVRTCDGYYFPISFSVTPDQFNRDEQKCQAMCPGTEVRLYSHRMPGEESRDMVSAVGTPYTELPNAFKYREAGYVRPEGCGCNPQKNFAVIAGEPPTDNNLEIDGQVLAPVPESRLETTTIPATVAADEAALGENTPEEPAEASSAEKDREIRVVGPRFLPDPAGAIDLRSPGRSEDR